VAAGDRIPPAPAETSGDAVSAERSTSSARIDLVGVGFVLLTSAQFGAVVLMGRYASRSKLTVPAYLMWRFGVSAFLLAAVVVVLRLPFRAAPGEGLPLMALGAVGYATEAALFFSGLTHGSAATVTLLFYTYPVLVSLLSWAFGLGAPGPLLVGALAATTTGSVLVVLSGGGIDTTTAGIVFSLASALTFAFYLIGAERVLKATNSLVGAMYVSAAASAGLIVYALLSGDQQVPTGWSQWGPIVGAGTFTAGAFVCLFAGLRRLGAVRTSIISATEPVNAIILAAIFVGETIGLGTAVGGVFILGGAVAAALAGARVPPAEPPVP
jgi:drug/metabolite transporter (DMT)-like permease